MAITFPTPTFQDQQFAACHRQLLINKKQISCFISMMVMKLGE
jgi:hypothetical protein